MTTLNELDILHVIINYSSRECMILFFAKAVKNQNASSTMLRMLMPVKRPRIPPAILDVEISCFNAIINSNQMQTVCRKR